MLRNPKSVAAYVATINFSSVFLKKNDFWSIKRAARAKKNDFLEKNGLRKQKINDFCGKNVLREPKKTIFVKKTL